MYTYPDDNYDGAILNFFEGDVPFWIANTESVSGMKKRESKSETFSANPVEFMRSLSKEKEFNKLAENKGMPSVTVNNDDARYNNALNPEKCEGRYVYDGQLASVNSIICDAANKMGYGDIATVDEAIDMIKGK